MATHCFFYPHYRIIFVMRTLIGLVFASVFLISAGKKEVPHTKFKFADWKSLKGIPEPSDIVYDRETNHCFIVSDHGKLFECDLKGNIIRKATEEGQDFEGVEVKDSFVYVSDETPRKVYQYRKSDLSLVKVFSVSWGGAMNRAFESITWNATKKCFVLVSQQPIVIVEYTTDFKEIARYPFKGVRDMSGARWHNGNMYLLSNLDACIIKCDPTTYEAKEYYQINVLNPEGFTFDDSDRINITSDDMQRLYFFNKLPTIQ